jgi:hypothetical protein
MEHIERDIETVFGFTESLREACVGGEVGLGLRLQELARRVHPEEMSAFQAAYHWFSSGMESVFLQDADSLSIGAGPLTAILKLLRERFPSIVRITSFARSSTIAKWSDEELGEIASTGLNRVHVGLESGSDELLQLVKKGCTKEVHIRSGLRVKEAGIELSECILFGLGGKSRYREHALETADAINQIDPHIIRCLTLAVRDDMHLFKGLPKDDFVPPDDLSIAREMMLFLENLGPIGTFIESDNALNLLQEVKGTMPHDQDKMIRALKQFIELDPETRTHFRVGKRLGIFSRLTDLKDPGKRVAAASVCLENGITSDNVDQVIASLVQRYI